jgi:hypothetical protein
VVLKQLKQSGLLLIAGQWIAPHSAPPQHSPALRRRRVPLLARVLLVAAQARRCRRTAVDA